MPEIVHLLGMTEELGSVSDGTSWGQWADVFQLNVTSFTHLHLHGAVVRTLPATRGWAETFTVRSRFIKTDHLFYHLLQLQRSVLQNQAQETPFGVL